MLQSKLPQLVIFGCGGHGRSVAATALALDYNQISFVDPAASAGERLLGLPVFDRLSDELLVETVAIAASGEGIERERQLQQIHARGLPLATLAAPSAVVAAHVSLGSGVFVGPGSYVGPLAQIEDGAIINSRAIVEHDSIVGAFTHISVGAVVAGRCRIGKHCFIGAGATIIDKIVIGDGVIVGAGATVVNHLSEPGTYIGTPAKRR